MVFHILKDGTMLTDLKGHVAKMSDVPTAYRLMQEISQIGEKNEKTNQREKSCERSR